MKQISDKEITVTLSRDEMSVLTHVIDKGYDALREGYIPSAKIELDVLTSNLRSAYSEMFMHFVNNPDRLPVINRNMELQERKLIG